MRTLLLSATLLLLASHLTAQRIDVPEPDQRSRSGSAAVECDTTNASSGWNRTFPAFNPNGVVYEIAVAPNGRDVYVGGEFTEIGGVSAQYVARWDGTTWHPLGAGLDGPAFAFAFHGDTLYVGGRFQNAGGALAKNIARWDGSAWTPLGTEFVNGVDSTVMALAVIGNDIYLGGNFTYTDDARIGNHIIRWNSDSAAWFIFDDGADIGLNAGVTSLAVVNDTLYVGGGFTGVGASGTARVVRWTGSAWGNLGAGVGPNGSIVTTLAADPMTGDLYVGGTFTLAGGRAAPHVARWSTTTRTWGTLGTGANNGVDDDVHRVVVGDYETGTGVYVLGDFRRAGGDSANYIAVWRPSDLTWHRLDCGLNDAPFAVGIQSGDSTVDAWVGGVFSMAGGKNSPYLAVWQYEPGPTTSAPRHADNPGFSITSTRGVNGVTEIRLRLEEDLRGEIEVDLVDMTGRQVRALYSGAPSGELLLPVAWDVPAGRYLCRVVSSGRVGARGVMIVR